MPLQDLTPQLRTRLNRMERAVGWFIMLATLLLLAGLGYYIYKTAENRGWFRIKAQYFVYTERGDGLAIGNKVKLMGFDVGRILEITPLPPTWGRISTNNVYVRFEVQEPNFGYIWTDSSQVLIKQSGFLSARELDITKGLIGYATYINYVFRDDMTVDEAKAMPHPEYWRLGQDILEGTNMLLSAWKGFSNNLEKISADIGTNRFCAINTNISKRYITAVWNEKTRSYEKFNKTNIYGLPRREEQAVTDRLNTMVTQIQAALPGILDLTNKVSVVLSNTALMTGNFNAIAASARPAVTNLQAITEHLRDPNGSLGQWLFPTNLNQKLDTTVESVNGAITNLNTNLLTLNKTLENLANMTGNLNQQVQRNSNLVTDVDKTIAHYDEMVQGLKHFWLFRHQFDTHSGKPKHGYTNAPVVTPKQK